MSRRLTFRLQKLLQIRTQEEKLVGELLAEKVQEYQLLEGEKEKIFLERKNTYAQTNQQQQLSPLLLQHAAQYLQALSARFAYIERDQRQLTKEIATRQAEYAQARSRVRALENFHDRWYQEQKKEIHKAEQRNIDALAMHVWEQRE